jgi:hypothetical protein
MKLNRIAAATATAVVAIVSGVAVTQHGAVVVALSANSQPVNEHSAQSHAAESHSHPVSLPSGRSHSAASKSSSTDPSLAWLESPGGQAQVTFNNDVDIMAGDLETESHSPTVANHLVFEADARVVRAEAEKMLSTRALLPTHNRGAYERMLKDFITVANLLQPGPGYGTTAQDYAAWYTALKASDITVW